MRRTISPGLLLRALDCLEERGVEMHSLLVAKEGELVYEAYWAPWNRDKLHRMYSVTKSFVSLAVGALVEDGLVSLDDAIYTFEYKMQNYAHYLFPDGSDDPIVSELLKDREERLRTVSELMEEMGP